MKKLLILALMAAILIGVIYFLKTGQLGTNLNVKNLVKINEKKLDPPTPGYTFIAPIRSQQGYLVDTAGQVAKKWDFSNVIAGDVELLDNGNILGVFQATDNAFQVPPSPGLTGLTSTIDKEGKVQWEYKYYSDQYSTHHDVVQMPNGNILMLVWDKISAKDAVQAGYSTSSVAWSERVIEVEPVSKKIVWEWRAWDHLVQDYNPKKDNYGTVADNPNLIDLNYADKRGERVKVGVAKPSIFYANGLEYDPTRDVVFISVRKYSEIWAIDHSTDSEQAASHSGGKYGRGGDLVYRFGNPRAYGNEVGEVLIKGDGQHDPNLIKSGLPGAGHMLVFSNGNDKLLSTVLELDLGDNWDLKAKQDNEPKVVWQFSHPDLFSQNQSGAARIANGNTMIAEGDYGLWEVNKKGEVLWKYQDENVKNSSVFMWRPYRYSMDAAAIKALGL